MMGHAVHGFRRTAALNCSTRSGREERSTAARCSISRTRSIDQGSARTTIEILTPKKYRETAAGKREGQGEMGGGARVTAERKALQAFAITKFVMVPGAAGFTFQIEGRALRIPDELRVQIKLMFGNRVIKDRSVPIKSQRFRTTFGPYKERLLNEADRGQAAAR